MHWGWRWAGIFVVVALLDFGVRFASGFDMTWVNRAEAVLLLGTALLLWFLGRTHPAPNRRQHTIQLAIVASFVLGGLRAALWAAGLPVDRANLAIAALGLVLVIEAIRRYRRGARRVADPGTGA